MIILILASGVGSVVCGILALVAAVPAWMFWVCLVMFWLLGFAMGIGESVSKIRLYKSWICRDQERRDLDEIEEWKSYIRKTRRELLTVAPFTSLMWVALVTLYMFGPVVAWFWNWFEDIFIPETKVS